MEPATMSFVGTLLALTWAIINSIRNRKAQRDLEKLRQGWHAEHQRLVRQSSIYDSERQRVYARLFKVLHLAEARVRALLQGPTSIPTFVDIDPDDLETLLPRRNFTTKVRRQIREVLGDPEKAQEIFEDHMVTTVLPFAARKAYERANRYYYLNGLYLPASIDTRVREILNDLSTTLQERYSGNDPAARYFALDCKQLHQNLDDLKSQMRQDMSGTSGRISSDNENDGRGRSALISIVPKSSPGPE